MGMKVNTGKTDLMLVSDSTSYVADTFIEDSEGVHIATVYKLKVLGFRISNRSGVHAHAESLHKQIRAQYWVLRHLKGLGFTQTELVWVYSPVIRPVLD